jgi:hypothetical protein
METQHHLKSISVLLRESWHLYSKKWQELSLIALAGGIVTLLTGTLFFFLLFIILGISTKTTPASSGPVGIIMAGTLFVFSGIVYSIAQVALMNAVAKGTKIKESFRAAVHLLPSYIWLMILTGVLVLGGMFLFIIPGIYLMTTFAFAQFILISENEKGNKALSTSAAYVRGRWWGIFSKTALVGILGIILSGLLQGILTAILGKSASGAIINLYNTLLWNPFLLVFIWTLFKNARDTALPRHHATEEKTKNIAVSVSLAGFILIILVMLMVPKQRWLDLQTKWQNTLDNIPTQGYIPEGPSVD